MKNYVSRIHNAPRYKQKTSHMLIKLIVGCTAEVLKNSCETDIERMGTKYRSKTPLTSSGLLLGYINISTHWGQVTRICDSKMIIIGSYNGMSPGRRRTTVLTNAGILSTGPMGINFNTIRIEVNIFHSRNCIWKRHLQNEVYFVSVSMG